MPLDYSPTCPKIDDAIDRVQTSILENLHRILRDVCPHWEGRTKDEFVVYEVDNIYGDIEDAFETVRKTNSDMRDVADDQIDGLERELEDLRDDVSYLREEVDKLTSRLSDSESYVFSLEVELEKRGG